MKLFRGTLRPATLAMLAVIWIGCKKQEEAPPAAVAALAPAPNAAAAAPTAPVSGGNTLKGVVKLTGTAPVPKPIKRDSDPYCARTAMNEEDVIVGPSGGLKNVLVRITKGVSGNYDPPMTSAELDQTECSYRPHVQAIMSGQSLLIKNSDQTLHNVHTYKGPSTIFNQAQVPGLPPMAKKFNNAGDIIKFKCDVHPWMTAYVAVLNHPFFAITGDDGAWSIPKLPGGQYTLEAWHERYGTKTTEVTVGPDKPGEVAFAFEAK